MEKIATCGSRKSEKEEKNNGKKWN